jgi:hypothetical protein
VFFKGGRMVSGLGRGDPKLWGGVKWQESKSLFGRPPPPPLVKVWMAGGVRNNIMSLILCIGMRYMEYRGKF